jgi:thioredoxin 1
MKTEILVLSLFCMVVNAREGKTFRQDMAERNAQTNNCRVCCEYQHIICAMEQPKPVSADITDEQRDMMRMYHLTVPPVIMGKERYEKYVIEKPKEQPVFSEAIPPVGIKVEVDKPFKPIELTIKKEVIAEIVDIPKERVKADFKPTQEQLDIMQRDHLTIPPKFAESNTPQMPDIGVAPQEIKIQAQTVVELSDTNFEASISNGTCVVKFGASWCMPCREMGPIFESVMSQHGTIAAFRVDVDMCPNTKARHGITAFPTFVMFNNGKRMDSRIGKMTREEIERWINR